MNDRDGLIEAAIAFVGEIKNKTPGRDVENWLNDIHGPGSPVYNDLAHRVKQGVEQGWAANVEITGRHCRRSRLLEPCEKSHYFSLTTVYMDSQASSLNVDQFAERGNTFKGDYHLHPYGEFNLVVFLERDRRADGTSGVAARRLDSACAR